MVIGWHQGSNSQSKYIPLLQSIEYPNVTSQFSHYKINRIIIVPLFDFLMGKLTLNGLRVSETVWWNTEHNVSSKEKLSPAAILWKPNFEKIYWWLVWAQSSFQEAPRDFIAVYLQCSWINGNWMSHEFLLMIFFLYVNIFSSQHSKSPSSLSPNFLPYRLANILRGQRLEFCRWL